MGMWAYSSDMGLGKKALFWAAFGYESNEAVLKDHLES